MNTQEVLQPIIDIIFDSLRGQIREIVREEINNKNAKIPLSGGFVSREESLKLFHPAISATTLWRWEKAGRVQAHRMGKRVFFKRQDILDSLQTLKKYSRQVL